MALTSLDDFLNDKKPKLTPKKQPGAKGLTSLDDFLAEKKSPVPAAKAKAKTNAKKPNVIEQLNAAKKGNKKPIIKGGELRAGSSWNLGEINDQFRQGVAKGAAFGVGPDIYAEEPRNLPEKAARFTGDTVGMALGVAGTGIGALTAKLGLGITKLIIKRAVQAGAAGGAYGTVKGTGKVITENKPLTEIPKTAVEEAALWAAGGALLPEIARPVGKLAKGAYKKVTGKISKPAAEMPTQPIPEVKPVAKPLGKLKAKPVVQQAQEELQKGVEAAQNYVQHNDILAAYPPGTTVEAAMADIKLKTGVDLPKLVDNLAQAEKAPKLREQLVADQERTRLGQVAGAIPKPTKIQGRPQKELPLVVPEVKPQAPKLSEKIISIADEAERAARERIASRKGRAMSGIPVDDIADYAVIGAAKITRGTVNYSVWAADMVKEFGNDIRPHLKTIYTQAKDIHGSYSGDASTFRNKVSRNVKDKKSNFDEFSQKIRTQFVDDLAPLEVAEKSVRGQVPSAEKSLYKSARLFKGTPTKAQETVKTGLNPIIKDVEKAGFSYEDLGDYALAIHARDVAGKGIETGFTKGEIASVVEKFGTTEMEAARQKLMQYNNTLLEDLADSGRISKELVTTLREKYPNYMSLFRSFDDDKIEFATGISNSLANVANPIKKLKGSQRTVIDPIESMIKNTFKITNAADRNRVSRQLLSLADDDQLSQFVRRLKPGEEKGRLNVLKVYENGKEILVEAEPELYKAMLNLDKESSTFLVELLQKPAALLRAGATLTPEFSLRNPLRDVLQAFVVSKSKFNPVTDFPIALANVILKGRTINIRGRQIKLPGELLGQFLKDNGGYGNVVSMDRKLHREVLEQALKQSKWKGFVNVVNPKQWLNLLRKLSDATETATKLGEYRAALRSGATQQEAAYRARDLMDFSRAGYSTRNVNRMVAFLNANIQGKSKLYRAIKENPGSVTARAAIAITLPTVGVFVAQKILANDVQKQVINDAPAWLKDTFWLIPVPYTNQVARIPKPFDLAPAFANLPERFLDYVFNNDPEAFDGFVKQTFSNASMPVMITGFTPILEGMSNYSFFRQGPIIPQREQKLQFRDQFDINTTETAKILSSAVGVLTQGQGAFKNFSSPRVMDNTITGLTAGLGRYGTGLVDFTLDKAGVVNRPKRAALTPGQVPLVRAFVVNQATTGKAVDDLYKLQDKLERTKNSAKLRGGLFREMGKFNLVRGTTERISTISKQMRKIQESKTITPEAKRERLDNLNKRRNEIAQKTMSRIRQLENSNK